MKRRQYSGQYWRPWNYNNRFQPYQDNRWFDNQPQHSNVNARNDRQGSPEINRRSPSPINEQVDQLIRDENDRRQQYERDKNEDWRQEQYDEYELNDRWAGEL